MSGNQRFCPVDSQFWPDNVRWPALISSPAMINDKIGTTNPFTAVVLKIFYLFPCAFGSHTVNTTSSLECHQASLINLYTAHRNVILNHALEG